jgi:hypothetical protein
LGPDRKSILLEVIGLVPSVRQKLTESRPVAHLYAPLNPASGFGVRYYVVKTAAGAGHPEADHEAQIMREIWREWRSGADAAPLMSVKTLAAHRDENPNLVATRVIARLLFGFGALAAVLAVDGIYGVTAFTVATRTREFEVRLALGSTRAGVFWMVLRQSLILAAVGTGIGWLLAWSVARWLSMDIRALQTFDFGVYARLPVALTTVVVLACARPARRAMRIDPLEALRCE